MPSRTRNIYGRHDLWDERGDLILYAGNLACCISIGTLARDSQFFEGFCNLPQPGPTSQDRNYLQLGRPLVECYDTAEELEDFLRTAYFDPHDNIFKTNNQVLNLLKLSDKYSAEQLVTRVIDGITQLGLFPTSLKQFQEMATRERRLFNDPKSIFRFIEVARHVAPYFLPSAYLLLSTFRGLHDHPDLKLPRRFYKGRENLFDIACYDIFAPLTVFECFSQNPSCSMGTSANRARVQESLCPDGRLPCPFYPPKPETRRCDSCRGFLVDGDDPAKLQRYWDELPSIFGLPSWEELLRGRPDQSTVSDSDAGSIKSMR